jgi:hypothetical protein
LNKKCFNIFRFYCQFALFIVYMAVCGATILMKRAYFFHLDDEGCVYATAEGRELIEECKCAYLYPNDSNRYVNLKFFSNKIKQKIIFILVKNDF